MSEETFQLYERAPLLRDRLPRVPLVERPTPVRRLHRLGRALGLAELWLKDDSGGPPVGGNKARKLEFLLADALARGRKTLVTVGYLGTNHGLATLLAARSKGLDCSLVLIEEATSEHVRDTLVRCAALGAKMVYAGSEVRSVPPIIGVYGSHLLRGQAPCWIPPGGSSPLGTTGYVEAGLELAAQVHAGELPEPGNIYVPLGSAGTAAGIALGIGMAGLRSRVRAVRVVAPTMASTARTKRLALATYRRLRRLDPGLAAEPPALALDCVPGFEGPGYGTETPEAMDAIRRADATEGLTLEVTYTGRALAALAREAQEGMNGPALLWNTFHPRGEMPDNAPPWQELPSGFHHAFGA